MNNAAKWNAYDPEVGIQFNNKAYYYHPDIGRRGAWQTYKPVQKRLISSEGESSETPTSSQPLSKKARKEHANLQAYLAASLPSGLEGQE